MVIKWLSRYLIIAGVDVSCNVVGAFGFVSLGSTVLYALVIPRPSGATIDNGASSLGVGGSNFTCPVFLRVI